MKAAELHGLSDEQLVHKALELERTMLAHSFRHRLGQLENSSLLGKARRDIARVQTILTAREHAASLNKGELTAKHRVTFVATAPSKGEGDAGSGFLSGILDKGENA